MIDSEWKQGVPARNGELLPQLDKRGGSDAGEERWDSKIVQELRRQKKIQTPKINQKELL